MLEKRTETGSVTVLADGQLQVRVDTIILDDGVEISRRFHRRVDDPATTDPTTLSGLERRIADALWTAQVIADRRARIAANNTTRG